MRINSVISLMTALLLGIGLNVVATAPAQAGKPIHDVSNLRIRQFGDNGPYVVIGAAKTAREQRVVVRRKACGTCNYRRFRTGITSERGRISIRLPKPLRGCYALYVPPTKDYAKFVGRLGCFYPR